MRLTSIEQKAIKSSFIEVFGEGKIYLFGSRVDESKKGGDIDLYIDSKNKSFEKKIKFLVLLGQRIGEQKIDVVLAKDKSRLIEQEATKNGIEL